jgi:hypothetical protein
MVVSPQTILNLRIEQTMVLRGAIAFLISLLSLGFQAIKTQAAPKLISAFPLGGQRGTALDVEVRGSDLVGTYAVWLGPATRADSPKSPVVSRANIKCTRSPDGFEASVKAVRDGSQVTIRLVIAKGARFGFHALSLVGPGGLSGSTSFWVGPHDVIKGTGTPHNTPDTAQSVKLPVAVNGRISKSGQVDYYAFAIARSQTVAFEVISLHGADFDPQLALYQAGGSYLDPKRSKRLLFHEEISQGGMPASRRMTCHFTKAGRYLVSLSNLFARGGAGSSYLLRISPVDRQAAVEGAVSWAKRRLNELRSRTVGVPAFTVELVRKARANEVGRISNPSTHSRRIENPSYQPKQAKAFKIPAVLEGTIGRPGDIDHFRFKAERGQKLVFEIQTPRAAAPRFNPRLDVFDGKGAVVLSNLQVQNGKIGTVDAKVIQVASQVMGTLEREDFYSLRIRDLASIHGSPEHVYRVLVRPQIPHVGAIRPTPNGPVNLLAGARQRLTLKVPAREGYAGTVALSVAGLPQGVRAFVGANNSTIELVADASAPVTPMPQVLRVSGLPQLGLRSGSAFPVAEIPIMIIKK